MTVSTRREKEQWKCDLRTIFASSLFTKLRRMKWYPTPPPPHTHTRTLLYTKGDTWHSPKSSLYLSIIYKKNNNNKQNELLRSLLEPQWPGAVSSLGIYKPQLTSILAFPWAPAHKRGESQHGRTTLGIFYRFNDHMISNAVKESLVIGSWCLRKDFWDCRWANIATRS